MKDRHSPPNARIRGRGAISNRSGRFERYSVEIDHEQACEPDESRPQHKKPATIVTRETTRRILTRNDSPDVPFDVSINPYKGCEHGCVYCFARPTHAYLGLSPGIDFETRIVSKPDADTALRRELARAGYRPEPIALGANTDPYQPVERELAITRRILEVLHEHRHPVGIVTKSSLVLRDADILTDMAARGLAHVHLSITTLDGELARRMEPRCAAPVERLRAIEELARAGIPTGILASPMIPALNDDELETLLEAAHRAGALSAGYILLRLPRELRELFSEWLDAHYPLRAKHVLSLVRDTRGGALYDDTFGSRMSGEGAYAMLLQRRFDAACARLGLATTMRPLDRTQFQVPRTRSAQLDLFGDGDGE